MRSASPPAASTTTWSAASQHAGNTAELEQAGGEHRTGRPGGDDGVGPSLGNRAHGGDERALRLGADSLGGLLVHVDHARGLVHFQPAGVEARLAEEHRLDPVRARFERTGHDLCGPSVSAHRVDRDAGHELRSVDAERLDLAAPVGAAGQADAMRPLRLPAVRADVHLRRADRVRRATLVAARLRGFPLGDGHDRRPL